MHNDATWRILLVEDDEDDYILTREMLENAQGRKFEVDWASSYEQGQKAIESNHYDAVLMDYDLGSHTGIDLMREAASNNYPSPIILLTGRGSYEVDVEAMHAGATLYLTKKEVNALLLERSIRYAIERKQTEVQLRHSEERFYKAFDVNPNAQVLSRIEDGQIMMVNASFEQLFGYSRDDVIGKTSLELNMFADQGMREEAVRRLQSDGNLRNFQVEIQTKFGKIRKASLAVEIIHVGNDNLMFTNIQDVTERNQVEDALRESEERFRNLADAMPQLVWTAKPDGTVDYYNKRYLEYGGIAPKETENWEWGPVLHPDDLEPTVEAWQQAVDNSEMYQIEHRVRMKNGNYRWHLSRGVPVVGEGGQVLKWYGTATDIHVQKQVEESLRLSERRTRKLIDANIIGVLYRTASGVLIDANDAYLSIIGYSRKELEQNEINEFDITPEKYRQRDIQALNEARKSGSCKPYEKEFLCKDGSRVPVLIGFAQLDPSEEAFVAFVLDLSTVKKAEAELQEYARKLEQSNLELENFAYMASHDLQEPLRKITAFGSRMIERNQESIDEEGKDILRRMVDASSRMQTMTDGLLGLSKINTQGSPFIPVDLNEVASTVVNDLETRSDTIGGKVIVERLPVINADPVQMQQLLQNLIGNALKYHKPGIPPVVKIYSSTSVSKEKGAGSRIEIFIEDNGIGFDERHLSSIFQPFKRLVGRSEYEGSGLGLAICKKIVERHGGTISAKSDAGSGSVFIVTLPMSEPGSD